MNRLSKLVGISAVALAFLACAGSTSAETLDIWVNATTWAFDHVNCPSPGDCHHDPEDGAWTNVVSYAVSGTNSQGYLETRYYFAGGWTAVNIWNAGNPSQLLRTLACNNIFYIKGTQAYALTVNENGGDAYNGTAGEVTTLHALSNGGLSINSHFLWAGGYDHAYNFTCYKFKDGWLNVGSGLGV